MLICLLVPIAFDFGTFLSGPAFSILATCLPQQISDFPCSFIKYVVLHASRTDYGCPGYAEIEEFGNLCSLVLSEGFRTDANLPGVERLAVMEPDTAFLDSPPTKLPQLGSHGDDLSCIVLMVVM